FGCRRGPPRGYPVAVLFAEAAGRIFGQRVAVTLPVGGAHEGSDDIEIPVVDLGRLTPEVGEPKVDIELQQVDAAWAFRHGKSVESRSDDTRGKPCFPREPPSSWSRRCSSGCGSRGRSPAPPALRCLSMGELRFGPARVP